MSFWQSSHSCQHHPTATLRDTQIQHDTSQKIMFELAVRRHFSANIAIIGHWKGLQHLLLETSSCRSEKSLNIQQLQTLIINLRELRYLRITGFTATRLQFEHLSIAFTDFLNVHRPSFKFSFVPNVL